MAVQNKDTDNSERIRLDHIINFFPKFISKNHKKLSRNNQTVVFYIILLFFLFFIVPSFVQPTVINGSLRMKKSDGTSIGLFGHKIKAGRYWSITDMEGNFTLAIEKRVFQFGKFNLEVISPPSDSLKVLGNVDIGIPILIKYMIKGVPSYIIEKNRSTNSFELAKSSFPSDNSFKFASIFKINRKYQHSTLKIYLSRIELRESDHRSSNAEVYVKVYIDDILLDTPFLPTEEEKDTWVLLKDNYPIALNSLYFEFPKINSENIKIELWDRDRFFDDLLASFSVPVSDLVTTHNMELEDELGSGSSIKIDIY